MKLVAYGYYNYGNTHDQKEHLTLCPKRVIDNCSRHDYSGNRYIFETSEDIVLKERTETCYDMTVTEDFAYLNSNVQIDISTDKGFAYITPDNPACGDMRPILLGNIKKALID